MFWTAEIHMPKVGAGIAGEDRAGALAPHTLIEGHEGRQARAAACMVSASDANWNRTKLDARQD